MLGPPRQFEPYQEQLEHSWWSIFAELEQILWAGGSPFLKTAREDLVKRIATGFASCGQVFDVGCGNGYITKAIAAQSTAKITGIDFAAEQIAIANETPAPNCDFRVGGVEVISQALRDTEATDHPFGILCHGFLHHLNAAEFRDLKSAIMEVLRPGDVLIVCEPVVFPQQEGSERGNVLFDRMARLNDIPNMMALNANTQPSPKTQALKALIEKRWWGEHPYGPSPKECPFTEPELDSLFEEGFIRQHREIVHCLSGPIGFSAQAILWALDAPEANQDPELGKLLSLSMDLQAQLLALPVSELPDKSWYFSYSAFERS